MSANITKQIQEDIYAGVLGKLIGVYLGRPVEGWSYEKIIETFGEIPYYVHEACGVPLIVADDDISGTFGFFRSLEDNGYTKELSAQDVGNTWLNYIIEDKTILWWGGLGRSTEHTAYLNLKNGIPAPQSGSIAQNSKTLAEQIGAQIFIDAFAMACPNNPDLAVDLIRKAASVSHDGLAVEAACYLGAMEAMAFSEKDIDKLLDGALKYVSNQQLLDLISDVRLICSQETDWHKVRDRLNEKYGYHIFPGCCHMVPNHAMVLASLIMGGDDFQKSIMIASSAAWDTDCNAGNVGALNGIRLGLQGINAGADFRTPVSDRALVISADGGEVVSDAVLEAQRIIRGAQALAGDAVDEKGARFSFAFDGATQGFAPCPYSNGDTVQLQSHGAGLEMAFHAVASGVKAHISTPTFIDFAELAKNFSTVASPTLYSGQTITATLQQTNGTPVGVAPYILYYDIHNDVKRIVGDVTLLTGETQVITWEIPATDGMPIFRVGFQFESELRSSGTVKLTSLDWTGAPKCFQQKGMLMTSIWNTNPYWTQSWASSAKHFAADFKYTYCVSHPEDNGLVTMGSRDWNDYTVSSGLCFALHHSGGLVARATGHRQYYAACLKGGNTAEIFMQQNGERTILASVPFGYQDDSVYQVALRVEGTLLQLSIDGQVVATTHDDTYAVGGAGFYINQGTMTADGFCVCKE